MPKSIASSARHLIDDSIDEDLPLNIDSDLRLRTVKSASGSIRESHRHDKYRERRRKKLKEVLNKKNIKDKFKKVTNKSEPVKVRRNVYANIPLPSSQLNKNGDPIVRYVRNKVRTAKYTLITFIPKNLFEQFRRVANIYFLLLVILQIFPIFGATTPQVAMLPLVAILVITGIKDAIEDYRRNVLDNQVNNSVTTKLTNWMNVNIPQDSRNFIQKLFNINKGQSSRVKKLQKESPLSINDIDDNVMYKHSNKAETMTSLDTSFKSVGVVDYAFQTSGTAKWEKTFWKKLQVGDFVLLRENDQVPADVVLLSTSDDDGLAYVETKNLDGETNLKVKKSLKATSEMYSEEDIEHARFIIDSEPPHANLYSYNGVLRYSNKGNNIGSSTDTLQDAIEPITASELLLRGCSLRNTSWAIGIVLFTGSDTKIMLNSGETPSKRSKIEKETNFNVAMNFIILIAMCAIAAIANGVYWNSDSSSSQLYEVGAMMNSNVIINSLITFCACLIAFQNIVS